MDGDGRGDGGAGLAADAADTLEAVQWHALPASSALERLATSEDVGLSEAEVLRRRAIFGPNAIEDKERFVWLKRLWRQINNILIYILLVSMVVSFALGKYTDGGVIAGVLVINIAVGMVMEGRAEKASEAIRRMLPSTCIVRRDDRQAAVPAVELVPGDIVLLNAGDKVPADLRLLVCYGLRAQEAILTGESLPVQKSAEPLDADAPLGDRHCLAFSGTLVASGSGAGVVVGTGERTEVGKINRLVRGVKNSGTPLLHKIEVFGRWLAVVILAIAALAFVIVTVREVHERQTPAGPAVADAFTIAVSMAVAAVPEGLPAIVTVVLSRAVRRMAKRNAIVRQLAAVETLGSVTTICSDKTGTLTKNEMTVVACVTPTGEFRVTNTGYDPVGDVLPVDRLEPDVPVSEPLSPSSTADADDDDDEAEDDNDEAAAEQQNGGGQQALPTASTADALELPLIPTASVVLPDDSGATPADAGVRFDTNAVFTHMAQCAALCNDAELVHTPATPDDASGGRWELVGDPTEGALVALACKLGATPAALRRAWPRLGLVPFESTHRFMATLHAASPAAVAAGGGGGEPDALLYVKGAPEAVLRLCATQLVPGGGGGVGGGGSGSAEPVDHARWTAAADRMAHMGLRTIALAFAQLPPAAAAAAKAQQLSVESIQAMQLCFVGITGILDPPRPEAIVAVAECHRAGIRVKMITGDHPETARAIASQLQLPNKRVLTGAEVAAMPDDELAKQVGHVYVFARSSPENKIRIVQALQSQNEIVSMTGDGVNDAPSLRQADIGVAMGITGTESAKEASKMVLADDNFATIAHAVREGRVVFDNLRKTLLFVLPTNVGQTMVIFLAVLIGSELPISAAQVLWINMITSITLGVGLAFEPEEGNVMARRPRDPNKTLWEKLLMWRMVFVGFVLAGGSLGLFQWELAIQGSVPVARAATVTIFAVGQMFYLVNCRFIRKPSFSMRLVRKRNRVLWLTIFIMLLLQVLFVYVPFMRDLFSTNGPVPMDGLAWVRALCFGIVIFFLVEAEKLVLRRVRRWRRRRQAEPAEA